MKIEFDVTVDDYVALMQGLTRRSKTHNGVIRTVIVWICVLLIGTALLPQISSEHSAAGYWTWLIAGPLVFLVIANPVVTWSMRNAATAFVQEMAPNALGRYAVLLSSEYLEVKSATAEHRLQWTSLRRVENAGVRTLLIFDNGFGFVVPNNAFSDATPKDVFVSELRRWAPAATSFS